MGFIDNHAKSLLNKTVSRAVNRTLTPNALISDVTGQVRQMLGQGIQQAIPSQFQSILQSINFNVSPNSIMGVMQGQHTTQYEKCGLSAEAEKDVKPEHRILITSRKPGANQKNFEVEAAIQEEVLVRTKSEWIPVSEAAGIGDIKQSVNAAVQAISGQTLVTRFTTRRIWKGTEPLSFSVSLKFEAYLDAFKEVLLPCMRIEQLALPSDGGVENGAKFLVPPGPNPFAIDTNNNPLKRGEEIEVRIGRFLAFSSVIVDSVQVTYSNRVDSNGNPMSAKADVNFQTYQIFTKEDMEAAHFGGSAAREWK